MIIFTRHAIEKLAQRKIKKEFVLQTLERPDHIEISFGNRRLAFKRFAKLYLRVVFRKEGKNTIVITQHWVEHI